MIIFFVLKEVCTEPIFQGYDQYSQAGLLIIDQ